MILDYLLSAIALGMTFLYGSTGEIITEKAGHLNLGIPGVMCVGVTGGCATVHYMVINGVDNGFLIVVLGILACFLGGALMGLLYSFLTVSLRANQNVTGLALTIFGKGIMNFVFTKLGDVIYTPYIDAVKYFRFPFNWAGNALQYCGVMVFLGIAVALVASFVLFKTKIGLNLRAIGESPATADAAGINVTLYKYVATLVGSGIAALGGLCYVMDFAGSSAAYKDTEALGWLAIALVIFATWKPHISIIGSVLFGALYIAGSFMPTLLPTYIYEMLPYLVTIIVLIITSIKDKKENQPPASLGLSYFREER